MSLAQYRQIAEDHWSEFLPKRWNRLRKAGTLDKELDRAANLTDQEMQGALEAGVPRDQAWEEIRGRYLLLMAESTSQDDEDREYGPNPNREALKLIQDAIDATQDVYDNL